MRFGVGKDRLRRAFRHADTAVDALVRMDDEHVLAFVEAVHGHTSTQSVYLHLMQFSVTTNVITLRFFHQRRGEILLAGRLDGSAGYRQRHLRRYAGK